mmetsp:Transcript_100582/g.224760  ORF Transcript_100582/g.224760 Transcript_100582/m.224760 type:complete len:114 (-) Transcript_100582:160-501(-)
MPERTAKSSTKHAQQKQRLCAPSVRPIMLPCAKLGKILTGSAVESTVAHADARMTAQTLTQPLGRCTNTSAVAAIERSARRPDNKKSSDIDGSKPHPANAMCAYCTHTDTHIP